MRSLVKNKQNMWYSLFERNAPVYERDSEGNIIYDEMPDAQEILKELLFRFESVRAAEDKKYVLMNAPTDRVKEIIEVLPGIKSPTVMPLATEGWSSIHTVLDEKRFWEIIGQLKRLGAEGILVLPIEKMIL